jgi:hypothetical protein
MTQFAGREIDSLAQLIADAQQVELPRQQRPRPAAVDLAKSREPIRIPEATVTLLEDYELYVG